MAKNVLIKGLAATPTLMRKAGISDYEKFAGELVSHITTYLVSLEVFADDFTEMRKRAEAIASWEKI